MKMSRCSQVIKTNVKQNVKTCLRLQGSKPTRERKIKRFNQNQWKITNPKGIITRVATAAEPRTTIHRFIFPK